MTNTKTTKRALVSSILALCLCFAMMIGTTYAWFTDSASSTSNIIKSGKLDVAMDWANGKEDPSAATWIDASTGPIFNNTLWEPGYTEARHLKISNVGNLALKWTLAIVPNGEVSALADVIDVYYYDDNGNGNATQIVDRDVSGMEYVGTLTEFLATPIATGNLDAEKSYSMTLVLKMRTNAGDEYQDLSIGSSFTVRIFATQQSKEFDSFDDQYDANAGWLGEVDTAWYNDTATEFAITSANELAGLAKLVNTGVDNFAGKTVKLSDNVDLINFPWTSIGTKANPFVGDFDGNGKTVMNLNVEASASSAGLFGFVGAGASVSNLNVHNAIVKDLIPGDDTAGYGAVIGNATASTPVTVDNVTVTGNIEISGDWYAGALVGRSKGAIITNCSVIGEDGSYVESGKWASGISGYDNGTMKLSGCTVENIAVKSSAYSAGLAALGAAGADVHGNTVKNVDIVLEGADASLAQAYGYAIGGVSVYSYSAKPITAYDNTYDDVTYTVNGAAAAHQEIGSKYPDGTDQGLIMIPTIKVGNSYYTYLKKAIEAAPKDGTEYVIELTGDTMISAKFKPSVANGQNIVIKTNGYKLLNVEQDANKLPVTNPDGSLVTIEVTSANMASYITVKTGGALVIE